MVRASIGIIGGSGLYEMEGIDSLEEVSIVTPYGEPSDPYRVGTVEGHRVAFLSRHGRGHRRTPSEINYRANIFGFKLLGVERILSASAVGSLRDEVAPLDVVIPDQLVDRTYLRATSFFGDGVVAHVSMADPFCPELRALLAEKAAGLGAVVHDGGTYLCMEGPQFSTRAESELHRSWGMSVIGMTNAPEAKLSREAEICYATIALVTDYDCWRVEEAAVTVGQVIARLNQNATLARALVRSAVASLGPSKECACGSALQSALITDPRAIPAETKERLRPLLARSMKEV